MTYIKEKHDFINEIINHIRQKIEVLENVKEVEVKILLSYPLRNDNPSVRVMFTSPNILAEAGFWSGKTFDTLAYQIDENEVLFGEAGYFSSLDEVDSHIEKLVSLFIPDSPNLR